MTVLVTGATGLLGSHLTDLLIARGERPRLLVRPGESIDRPAGENIEICRGDMSDRASLEAAVQGVERVLHCAARTGPWGPAAEYRATNVQGLNWLVELAIDAGVRRFVHVSSITVHGNDVRGSADESAPMRTEPNPYSRSKVAAERLLRGLIQRRGAPVTIVRPGWIYGPRDTASFGRFAAMIERRRMLVIGSGNNHLPLIYVRDVAEAILLAGEADGAAGRTYLLVNDEPVTQLDYLSAIAAALDVEPPTRHMPYAFGLTLATMAEAAARLTRTRRSPPVMRYGIQLLGGENRFSIRRARQELGFAPGVGVAEGVKRSVAWYRGARQALVTAEAAA